MSALRVSELRWPAWLRQLGWPGLLGAGLLLACAGFIQLELPQRRADVAQAESDARRLRHGLLERANGANGASRGEATSRQEAPMQAWSRLWAGLPDEGQRLVLQGRVLASAAQVGVPLQAVQWQGEAVKWGPGLWRQRMTMPVQAPYPALRTWLDRLQREPALSVDTIDIQRNDLTSDQVQAQVSVSLWWRQPKPKQELP